MLALNDTYRLTKLQNTEQQLYQLVHTLGQKLVTFQKAAGDAEVTHALAGRLYASSSGWILLEVPNAIVRGLHDALDEPGTELPLKEDGRLNAHISVMRPEELQSLGGPDRITERGHTFRWNLGPVKKVRPSAWKGISRVWYATVHSPELQALRRSYGLTSLPNNNLFDFHLTFAISRMGVLRENAVCKGKS